MTLPNQPARQPIIKKAILILGISTGLIHLVLLNFLLFANGTGIDYLFTLNGIGYLVLVAAYFNPRMAPRRNYIRWLTIVYTLLTILAWIVVGDRGWLGILTKLIEVSLIVFLILDGRKTE
jgi:hypothetical protein